MNTIEKKIDAKLILSIIAAGIMSFSGVVVETAMNVTFPTLMKEFNMSQEDLKNFYYASCNLSLDDGDAFGNAGIGFMRFNLATQKYYVEKAMNNIAEAVKNLKK